MSRRKRYNCKYRAAAAGFDSCQRPAIVFKLGQIFEISDRSRVGQKSELFDRPGVAETEILELAKNLNGQRTLFRKRRQHACSPKASNTMKLSVLQ
jgi:hypothetical protein